MAEDRERAKREEGCFGPQKRLFSPPDESHSAKRPRTANTQAQSPVIDPTAISLKVRGPAVDPVIDLGLSEGLNGKEMTSLKPVCSHSLGEQREQQEEAAEDKNAVSAAEGKSSGKQRTQTSPHTDTHKPSTHTAMAALQMRVTEVSRNEEEAPRTAVTDKVAVTSSDGERAGGTVALVIGIATHHVLCVFIHSFFVFFMLLFHHQGVLWKRYWKRVGLQRTLIRVQFVSQRIHPTNLGKKLSLPLKILLMANFPHQMVYSV